jgi:hypothetical protein
MKEKPNVTQPLTPLLIMILLGILTLGGLFGVTVYDRNAMAMELDRRPAIGYPVYRGEYTIMIMNMHLGEVYWFTNCPRLKEFTRYEEVAIYGDHRNRCHDWRTLTPSEHEISKK